MSRNPLYPVIWAGCLALLALPLAAQPVADPSQDRATLNARLEARPDLKENYARIETSVLRQMGQRPVMPASMDGRIFLINLLGIDRRRLSEGSYPYRTALRIEAAAARARTAARILVADFDGDWQVTREELRDYLGGMTQSPDERVIAAAGGRGPTPGAAELFMLGDLNADGVLDEAEIKAVIALAPRNVPVVQGRLAPLLEIFDLDDDGVLTPEELDRSVAAMALN